MQIKQLSSKIIGFYGYSDSGKTSLIIRLISDLKKQGFSVAVIKRTDKSISSEPADKDTSAFRAAGAALTAFSSEKETNFVLPTKMKLDQILETLPQFSSCDLILVEGAYEPHTKKIRFGEIPERENTVFTYAGDYDGIKNFILNEINKG